MQKYDKILFSKSFLIKKMMKWKKQMRKKI